MESMMAVAGCLYRRYKEEYQCGMGEMKLHKLMYFAQRESFIQNGEPLFDGFFRAWKYGPVLNEIRAIYRNESFSLLEKSSLKSLEAKKIIDMVYDSLANKDSWSLSSLTHLEYSWKNARRGVPEDAPCDTIIKNEDIMLDAKRIKDRRTFANL